MRDVIIIGGGASGMAIACYMVMNCPGINIAIIEKKEELGKKLSATGNGKCNISNTDCENYLFTKEFFSSIGIEIYNDSQGRCYPISKSAKDVVEAMSNVIIFGGVHVNTNSHVEEIQKTKDCFEIKYGGKLEKSKSVVIATGGKTFPEFGTTGDGTIFAKKFGHNISKLVPVLTPIECNVPKSFGGIRTLGNVKLFCKGSNIYEESGEIQFTKTGISGICVFNVSRFMKLTENIRFIDYKVAIDFLYGVDDNLIITSIYNKKKIKGLKADSLFLTIINKKIVKEALKRAGVDENKELVLINDSEIKRIISQLRSFEFEVTGAGGWKQAQCTSGGVSLEEVSSLTCESSIVSNLYFAGEVLDFDGPCGGFNLQNAWDTAMKVGKKLCIEYIK
ncbi:MAG: aminoacetone oxidase family FAD-binding enzyme [Anaerovoracaceae bacterium]